MGGNIPPALPIPSWTYTHRIPGKLMVSEVFFEVPLDYSHPEDERRIRIFVRVGENFDHHHSNSSTTRAEKWMVYISGGPGFGAPLPWDCAWTGTVLERGYNILYLDHRGMGLSTPVTAATLAAYSDDPEKQAEYLTHFRADNAVRDLEAIRLTLTADYPEGDKRKKWSVMGQSYGGFVVLTYLSFYPEGLKEAFILGGLAPVSRRQPEEVVRRLFRRVLGRNVRYFEKFPEDRDRVKKVVEFLRDQDGLPLSDGGTMTARRFLSMGVNFGFHGGLDRVHDVVLRCANDLDLFGNLTRPTLSKIMGQEMQFDDHPIYGVLHEAIYCQGQPSNWTFSRVVQEFPQFSDTASSGDIYFRGEMVFREDFHDYSELSALRRPAEILADKKDWPDLYDLDQLKKNEVPVYAATFMEDMYVDFDLAQETAALVKGCKSFITNVLYHDAIRKKTKEVFRTFFALRDDTLD